jgi:hypothetical protein
MSNPRAPRTEDEDFPVRRPSPFARFLTGLMAFSAGVFICGACGS